MKTKWRDWVLSWFGVEVGEGQQGVLRSLWGLVMGWDPWAVSCRQSALLFFSPVPAQKVGAVPRPKSSHIPSTELEPGNLDLDSGVNPMPSLALISPLIQRGLGLITLITCPPVPPPTNFPGNPNSSVGKCLPAAKGGSGSEHGQSTGSPMPARTSAHPRQCDSLS